MFTIDSDIHGTWSPALIPTNIFAHTQKKRLRFCDIRVIFRKKSSNVWISKQIFSLVLFCTNKSYSTKSQLFVFCVQCTVYIEPMMFTSYKGHFHIRSYVITFRNDIHKIRVILYYFIHRN